MKTLRCKQWPQGAAIGKWSAILQIATSTIAVFSPPLLAATNEMRISDFGITANVEEELTLEKGVFPNDLDVSTSQGIVTISGSAESPR
jgi:hypothetical protein